MPISLTCQCGKEYQLSDSLAGKKGRCKACGSVFEIPAQQAKTAVLTQKAKPIPAAKPAAVDLFAGLDDGPAVVRSPSSSTRAAAAKFGVGDADLDDEPAPPPRRRASAPRAKARAEADHEAQDRYRRSGWTMLIFGGLAFVLPMIGLQWRLLSFMPPQVQMGIAAVVIVLGICSMGMSTLAQPPRLVGPIMLVLVGGLAVAFGVFFLPGMMRNEPNPPPRFQATPTMPTQVNLPPRANFPQAGPNFSNPAQNNNAGNAAMSPPGGYNGPMQPMVPPNMGIPPGMPRPPMGPPPGFPGRRRGFRGPNQP